MNLKLFIVMGISWLLEILATIFNSRPMWWYISDFFNLLQGVLVCVIFVFKRKVFVAFQKKLGKFKLTSQFLLRVGVGDTFIGRETFNVVSTPI